MKVKSYFGAKKFSTSYNVLFILLFHPVLFSNVVLFSLNFNLSYRFVITVDLAQEDF